VEASKFYSRHDLLVAHRQTLLSHLTQRGRDLFNASFDVLLSDLTSAYFEVNAADLPKCSKRRHGYSRDKRPDTCKSSSRSSSRPGKCRWPSRFCLAIPPTARRCAHSWPGSKANMAKRSAFG
jgi:hypothetical protein